MVPPIREYHLFHCMGVLTVCFNQVLYELRVTEISGACVMLVHLGYLCHIIITQREVEDVDILCHALLVARFGNSHNATLSEKCVRCFILHNVG